MKRFSFITVIIAVLTFGPVFHVEHSQAQGMDIAGLIVSPQSDDGMAVTDRTFGYGASATYMVPYGNELIQPVATLQYHNHAGMYGKDLSLSGGLRLDINKNAYAQGTLGFVEKRDAISKADVKLLHTVSVGYQPTRVGAIATYYASDYGKHYALGLVLRL